MRAVLVTGGTRGIGLACARLLAGQGVPVIAAARRAPEKPLPEGVRFTACDVTDPASVRALFAGIEAETGPLRAAILAAGVAGGDPPAPDEEHWRRIMASNLDGAWRCAEAAAAVLPDGEGRIVLLSSVLGLRAVPDQVAYSAAKHGVIGLMRALALRLAPRGITVNALCPGWVETGMARARWAELGMTASEAAAGTPTGRITGAGEVAETAAFLLSPAAANITGQAIAIDGGAGL
ncbi:SDR family NAD(P)-dependent oxidoreductase [Muricoccus pecuniae]|uniref:NAD(P)-dependent dehydrogenase (Short-subunit alcohol dehydrogenase family) n=1 Tax=Muricoccus pecuniae TaxID=693023 RepID=A0A840XZC4_9PROT|nr:SDR family oxidoreductase [Roseomonas pecuniae]MBB5693236.1 NAD(P)-dependent dehydrogenase (short-subunit alcohol dehydrogenase family) [Roseomonas pecuniae]